MSWATKTFSEAGTVLRAMIADLTQGKPVNLPKLRLFYAAQQKRIIETCNGGHSDNPLLYPHTERGETCTSPYPKNSEKS